MERRREQGMGGMETGAIDGSETESVRKEEKNHPRLQG